MPEGPLSWDNGNWGGLTSSKPPSLLLWGPPGQDLTCPRMTYPHILLLCQAATFPPIPRSPAKWCWQPQHRGAPYRQEGALISHCAAWECGQSTGLIDMVKFFSFRDWVVVEIVKAQNSHIHMFKHKVEDKVSFIRTVVTILTTYDLRSETCSFQVTRNSDFNLVSPPLSFFFFFFNRNCYPAMAKKPVLFSKAPRGD